MIIDSLINIIYNIMYVCVDYTWGISGWILLMNITCICVSILCRASHVSCKIVFYWNNPFTQTSFPRGWQEFFAQFQHILSPLGFFFHVKHILLFLLPSFPEKRTALFLRNVKSHGTIRNENLVLKEICGHLGMLMRSVLSCKHTNIISMCVISIFFQNFAFEQPLSDILFTGKQCNLMLAQGEHNKVFQFSFCSQDLCFAWTLMLILSLINTSSFRPYVFSTKMFKGKC